MTPAIRPPKLWVLEAPETPTEEGVLLALLAQSLKAAHPDDRIWIFAPAPTAAFLSASPAVDEVLSDAARFDAQVEQALHSGHGIDRRRLVTERFACEPQGWVRAVHRVLDPDAAPFTGTLELRLNAGEALRPGAQPRALLVPGGAGENQAWPAQQWQDLARRLQEGGWEVLSIHPAELAFVQACRAADLLITDQASAALLAGASDIALLGLFPALPPAAWMPWRHGIPGWRTATVASECPMEGCLGLLSEPWWQARFQGSEGGAAARGALHRWCVADESYACLRRHLDAARVFDTCQSRFRPGPSDPMADPLGEGLDRARQALAERRPADAARCFQELVKARPHWVEALEGLALAWVLAGEIEAGARAIRALSLEDPGNGLPRPLLAYLKGQVALNDGRAEEGLTHLQPLLGATPPASGRNLGLPAGPPRLLAGFASLALGDLGAAEARFQEVLQWGGEEPDARFGLGEVAASRGQRGDAEAQYRRALAADSTHPWAAQRLQELGETP